MTPREIVEHIRARALEHPLGDWTEASGTYLITVGGDAPLWVKIRIQPELGITVEEVPGSEPADATATLPRATLVDILQNQITPAAAFMAGDLVVDGDLTKALLLYALIA